MADGHSPLPPLMPCPGRHGFDLGRPQLESPLLPWTTFLVLQPLPSASSISTPHFTWERRLSGDDSGPCLNPTPVTPNWCCFPPSPGPGVQAQSTSLLPLLLPPAPTPLSLHPPPWPACLLQSHLSRGSGRLRNDPSVIPGTSRNPRLGLSRVQETPFLPLQPHRTSLLQGPGWVFGGMMALGFQDERASQG